MLKKWFTLILPLHHRPFQKFHLLRPEFPLRQAHYTWKRIITIIFSMESMEFEQLFPLILHQTHRLSSASLSSSSESSVCLLTCSYAFCFLDAFDSSKKSSTARFDIAIIRFFFVRTKTIC